MAGREFPTQEETCICFAHIAYPLEELFEKRNTGIQHFQAWSPAELNARLPQADVLVISGFWNNELLENAPRLRFIQSIGAGYDQFPQELLRDQGIRLLANAQGVNRNAVAQHGMAMILSLARHLHTGRDNQRKNFWRNMISDVSRREDELGGKTLLIVGMGEIGSSLATLAKAFDMRVLATKRNPATAEGPADAVYTPDHLLELLPQADFVTLTCPLTPETERIIDADAFAAMKPSAYLINIARGGCVDEPVMLDVLQREQIAGAAIDHFWAEPLPADSPLWQLENLIITPHTGGETRMYEENLFDILLENLDRLWRGEETLLNQVV